MLKEVIFRESEKTILFIVINMNICRNRLQFLRLDVVPYPPPDYTNAHINFLHIIAKTTVVYCYVAHKQAYYIQTTTVSV